jgi:hypothetical protein
MHTHFKPGKRVLLTFRDGRPPQVHKFVNRLRDSVLLEGGVKVRVALLRNISIYKDRSQSDAATEPK